MYACIVRTSIVSTVSHPTKGITKRIQRSKPTSTMAKLAKDGLDPFVASTTIMLGVGSNTLVKGGVALVMGGRLLGRRVLGAFGVELVLAAVGLLVVRLV